MKRLFPVLAVMLAFTMTLAPNDAYAKRFGGGKSFGKSFRTAPSQNSLFKAPPAKNTSQQTGFNNASTSNPQSAMKSQNPSRKRGFLGGMMGGLLGGMLMGGLIGSMLGGGPFHGIQFMDILIFAGLAFLLFKLFRMMNRPRASAMNGGYQSQQSPWQGGQQLSQQSNPFQSNMSQSNLSQSSSWADDVSFRNDSSSSRDADFGSFEPASPGASHQSNGFGASENDVPFNLPADFDLNGFLNRSRNHYRAIQEAWNSGDLETIRDYVSPDLFDHLKRERATLTGDQHTEVMYVDAELVRADHLMGKTELSLKFSGRYRDNVERVEEKITDIWHLEQAREGAPWLIVGIEYSE
ncbi:Tim44 domain-containing protein [Sansalvadorimonas verongulae]|nr:Tim44 domain-containing protein [Sansalvadorimonas verongulae]